jgi:hypothetical protein
VHWGKAATVRKESRIENLASLSFNIRYRGTVDTNNIWRCNHLALTQTGDNSARSHDASRKDLDLWNVESAGILIKQLGIKELSQTSLELAVCQAN